MAWTTCKYCGKRTNGWDAEQGHARDAHPLEAKRDNAQQRVEGLQDDIARQERLVETRRVYEETLANFSDLPHQVVKLLKREVGDGSLVENYKTWLPLLRLHLQELQAQLAEAEAALNGQGG